MHAECFYHVGIIGKSLTSIWQQPYLAAINVDFQIVVGFIIVNNIQKHLSLGKFNVISLPGIYVHSSDGGNHLWLWDQSCLRRSCLPST